MDRFAGFPAGFCRKFTTSTVNCAPRSGSIETYQLEGSIATCHTPQVERDSSDRANWPDGTEAFVIPGVTGAVPAEEQETTTAIMRTSGRTANRLTITGYLSDFDDQILKTIANYSA
jgi:hypothetical protein